MNFPFDVLSLVVSEFIGNFHDDPHDFEDRKLVSGSVARSWRFARDNTHCIWAGVLVTNYSSLPSVNQQLLKAGSLPLHVHFDLRPRHLLPRDRRHSDALRLLADSWLSLFASHNHGCECLTIITRDRVSTEAFVSALSRFAFPSINRLHLRLHNVPGLPYSSSLSASHPIHLTLTDSAWPVNDSLLAATASLHISGSLHSLWSLYATILPSAAHLTSLELSDVVCFGLGSLEDIAAFPALRLPAVVMLKTSIFTTPTLLVHHLLDTPLLRKLHLAADGFHLLPRVATLCTSTFRSVTDLHLRVTDMRPDTLASFLLGLPLLSQVDVSHCSRTFGILFDKTAAMHPQVASQWTMCNATVQRRILVGGST
ncbi:hypothetical protein DFH06DRAFT_1346791 [Mycena polygramma]|nr:hypothetical protein DFH06DRAFT_1346791 [Mycena polygramma]